MYFGELRRLISFKDMKPLHWVILLSAFIVLNIPSILNDNGHSNSYVLLAKSLCEGKLSLSTRDMSLVKGTNIPDTGDLISYDGKFYLPYPPAPALIIIPFLPINKGYVNSVLIAVLLTCLSIYLIYRIFRKIGIQTRYVPWLIYGFIFGTSYWFVLVSSHHVYGFAEVVSVTALLLLLNELFGKKRALLLGLFMSIAFLSRQLTITFTILVLGVFFYEYLHRPVAYNLKLFLRKTILFLCPVGASIILLFLYNDARFGNPLDTGYENIVFIGVLKARVEQFGVFSDHYVLYNLYSYLFKGFNIEFIGKGMLQIKDMDLYGTALLVASPFFVAAFKTGWSKFLRAFSWITIGIIFTALLFYHNNGKDQVNASRFTLDFLPIMLVLAGIGAKNIPYWLFKSMVIYSIILNIIATIIHLYYHTLRQ